MDPTRARALERRLEAELNDIENRLEEARRELGEKAERKSSREAVAAIRCESEQHAHSMREAVEEARAAFERVRQLPLHRWEDELPGLEQTWRELRECLGLVQASAAKH